MRDSASIMHLDLDAFFASAEQRDKPSLRGRPVIVGGTGTRGVVATASYEARVHGVRSAMSTVEARRRCPRAAFLTGRFDVYIRDSAIVMSVLRSMSARVEPLSLDEAFVDLGDATPPWASLPEFVTELRDRIARETGGLTCSVGVASSKLLAKIASELNKPDGQFLVEPGTEQSVLAPLDVRALPGVGPATAARLEHIGVNRVNHLLRFTREELQDLIGDASGSSLFEMARARDSREVQSHRENKSVSIEDTFARDIRDRPELERIIARLSARLTERLHRKRLAGRTITLKIRHHDFQSATRSATLAGPTDQAERIRATALALLADHDVSDGIRLLGVGVSGLADWVQEELFTDDAPLHITEDSTFDSTADIVTESWRTGMDIHHRVQGDGWVWGAGLGRVTVRFETRDTPPGPVRTFAADDSDLSRGHVGTVKA